MDLHGLRAGLYQLRGWSAERGLRGGAAALAGGPLVVIYAVNLEVIAAAVQAAGGRITQPTFDFPGGRRFHFVDPSGHELAVWSDPLR